MKTRKGQLFEPLEPASPDGRPLYARVCVRIRRLILDGALRSDERLPSARGLARDLGISRTTVETAYSQLVAEGFLKRRVGAGTFVAEIRPQRSSVGPATRPPADEGRTLSRRGEAVGEAGRSVRPSPDLRLANCVPAIDEFPVHIWNRLLARRARGVSVPELRLGDPAGHRPLREVVAAHFAAARGVRCDWRRVFIVSGTQRTLDLVGRILLDPGDRVLIEDPHYLGARAAFAAAQAEVVPVPVDAEGFDISIGEESAADARMAYVTPLHQFPTGVTLSLTRRLALLDWAARRGAWIVEDDYDSEFRYAGRPLASLQGIDDTGRAIYAGTFNKCLFPALRLGFVIVPARLVEPLADVLRAGGGGLSYLRQAVLADFIAAGHLAQHIRRMRRLYRERRDALVDGLRRRVGHGSHIAAADTGLHLILYTPGRDDLAISRRAARASMDLPALSQYYLGPRKRSGLLVTFANEPATRADGTAERIAKLL